MARLSLLPLLVLSLFSASALLLVQVAAVHDVQLSAPHAHAALAARDAYTNYKSADTSVHLKSVGDRPAGAYGRTFTVKSPSGGSGKAFMWWSKTPHKDADADTALIILHGKLRNAGTYWSTFNHVWKTHEGLGAATSNVVRVAPQFFSTKNDGAAYNASSLAYADSNGWQAGDASTHPAGARVSTFSVLDHLLDHFADGARYPKLKHIIFVGHGGGGQLLTRYAVLGKDLSAAARARGVSVRYVTGDPSSQLYFTRDRPVAVDEKACDTWNSYRYALHDYTPGSAYPLPLGGSHVSLFKRFASRDVRYVIGGSDTKTGANNGDQSCMARAQGGAERTLRNQAYWKYINLLGAHSGNADVSGFHGDFPALDAKAKTKGKDNPKSTAKMAGLYKGTHVQHRFALITGAGHDAAAVYGSKLGGQFLFADRRELKNSPAP